MSRRRFIWPVLEWPHMAAFEVATEDLSAALAAQRCSVRHISDSCREMELFLGTTP